MDDAAVLLHRRYGSGTAGRTTLCFRTCELRTPQDHVFQHERANFTGELVAASSLSSRQACTSPPCLTARRIALTPISFLTVAVCLMPIYDVNEFDFE
ncbi:MAG TPA: hypothetical protein VKR81_04485, partial [Candidatus Binatia bacterium]|nr:hypothetical protein [Candidatus Binatia bacterium]